MTQRQQVLLYKVCCRQKTGWTETQCKSCVTSHWKRWLCFNGFHHTAVWKRRSWQICQILKQTTSSTTTRPIQWNQNNQTIHEAINLTEALTTLLNTIQPDRPGAQTKKNIVLRYLHATIQFYQHFNFNQNAEPTTKTGLLSQFHYTTHQQNSEKTSATNSF